jgi:hypothetical protein
MKTTLHKLIGTAVLGLALVSQSLPAWAGLVYTPEVSVSSSGAVGSMAGARYSTDSTQYIGCTFSNTSGPYVLCNATNNTGNSLFCVTTESKYLAAAKAITDFSYIYFAVTPGSGFCTYLQVQNYSQYLR